MIPPASVVSSVDFNTRHALSLIPLCLVILEYGRTCRFEFTHIWRRPLCLSKVLFVFCRYYEILGKAVHYCLIHLILGRSPLGVSPQRCAIWYILMFSECITMAIILDVIMLLRVYALRRKNSFILVLVIPISFPYISGIYNALSLWANRREVFDGVCNVFFKTSPSLSLMCLIRYISYTASQLIIWLCIYVNRNVGQGHVSVVKLVVRDGLWVFLILFAIVAALMPVSIAVNIENPFLTYVCSPTLISVLICRIIARMHNLAMDEAARMLPLDDEDFPLTTFIYSQFTEEN